MKARTQKDHPCYYAPFANKESRILRKYHMAQVKRLDPARPLISLRGVQIASDFTRIVVGDYGAYIEFSPEQVVGENLRPKFMQETPSRPVKYIWLTTEHGDAKVYHHQCRVQYAEYVPGMHYVALGEVTHSS